MSSYKDSKYYELQEELIRTGAIKTDEGREQDLRNYEEELNWPDNGGDWLASHFNSTAEHLADSDPDCISDEEFERLAAHARKEIEVTRKANGGRYDHFAGMYEEWLMNAIVERNTQKEGGSSNE